MKSELIHTTPKISVVVPIYNIAEYVPALFDAIRAQTFCDFEVILIDDGSTDESAPLCDAFAASDKRVRVIHKENGGLSSARNAGTATALGSWITYVDGDDSIHPDYLRVLYDLATTTDAQIACVRSIAVTSAPRSWEPYPARKTEVLSGRGMALRLSRNAEADDITAWGKLYDASLKELLLYPTGKVHEDEFVTYKVMYAATHVVRSSFQGYAYIQRAGSISHTFTIGRLDRLEALRGAIDFYCRQGDDECANYARKRYLLNIPMSYYRAARGGADASVLFDLRELHRTYRAKWRKRLGTLMSAREKAMDAAFAASPALYCLVSRAYLRLFQGERG